MASSATVVWSSAGRSKVEAMTSPLDRALHVGDLFGALVDEHDHEVDLGVVGRDRVGDLLQHDRLAGLGRRDDEAALALADRGDEVDDALRELLGLGLEAQALLRVERRQLAELDAGRGVLDRQAVDRVDLDERVVLLAAATARPRAGCLIAPTTASPLRRLYFLTWPSET